MADLISFVPTSTSTASNADASKATLSNNFDTFLTILTAQIQNQDPLQPIDSTQFTQQLVQFSGVEQQIRANSQLETLIRRPIRAPGLAVGISRPGSRDRLCRRRIHWRHGPLAL
ncbi:MAG: flagellar hook capping FlgD N-terminal domain-containing protein [Hyphomonadaceae bacterium]